MQVDTLVHWLREFIDSPSFQSYRESIAALRALYQVPKGRNVDLHETERTWQDIQKSNRLVWELIENAPSSIPFHEWIHTPEELASYREKISLFAPDWPRCAETINELARPGNKAHSLFRTSLQLLTEIHPDSSNKSNITISMKGQSSPKDLVELSQRTKDWGDLFLRLWGTPVGRNYDQPALVRIRSGSAIFDILASPPIVKCIELITAALKFIGVIDERIRIQEERLQKSLGEEESASAEINEYENQIAEAKATIMKAEASKAQWEAEKSKWEAEKARIAAIEDKLKVATLLHEARSAAKKLDQDLLENLRQERDEANNSAVRRAAKQSAAILGAKPEDSTKIEIAMKFVPEFFRKGGSIKILSGTDIDVADSDSTKPLQPSPAQLNQAPDREDDSPS